MSTQTTSRHTLRIAALGALSALALSACAAGTTDEPDVMDPPQATPEETTEDPAPEPTTADEPTSEEPTPDVQTSAPPQDVQTSAPPEDVEATTAPPVESSDGVPPPGAEFQVGDAVTTHVQALEEGDEFYGFATLATTVTDVAPADPSLFESAENSADFAGLTPWYVTVEHEWLTYEGEPNANMIPNLVAFNADGGEVSPVINSTFSAGIPGCSVDIPDEKGAGEVASNCQVFAVPEGESVSAVGWRGDDLIDGGGSASDNPYYDDPVLWLAP